MYKKGKPLYIIERLNLTIGELFNDREHIVYVNGAYEGDSEIGRLMHDFRCSNPDDMYYEPMKKKSKYLKESKEGVAHMCKVMDEALKQEAKETRVADIKNLMTNLKWTAEQAMAALNIPQSEQAAYAKLISTCSVAVRIPDEVLYDTKMNNYEASQFASQMTALGLYTQRKVSLGYCAEIAGMSEAEFIAFLAQNHISVFRFDSEDELLRDIKNA